MAKRQNPASEPSKPTDFPYPDYVKSDPALKSIFDRISSGQHFGTSEITHFIAPLVKDFEVLPVLRTFEEHSPIFMTFKGLQFQPTPTKPPLL